MFTFVIPARNEEATVATTVEQARAAAQPGDRVLVVDSGSTDDTAGQAAKAGAEVLRGPRGKGAAMALAVADVTTEWVVFLDADLTYSEGNVAAKLREAAESSQAGHLLGNFERLDQNVLLCSTFGIYEPLVAVFFPEVKHLCANSLTGFRAIRRSRLPDSLPTHFGVESYLNVITALEGTTTSVCHLGVIACVDKGPRNGDLMRREIAETIFDLAEAHGRLSSALRPAWERWAQDGIEAVRLIDPAQGRLEALSRLFAVTRRPMPPTPLSLDLAGDELALG